MIIIFWNDGLSNTFSIHLRIWADQVFAAVEVHNLFAITQVAKFFAYHTGSSSIDDGFQEANQPAIISVKYQEYYHFAFNLLPASI